MKTRPNCIIIMDGYGINCQREGNAIKCANSTNVDYYMENYPCTLIGASGMDVGLPEGQMGNSEVGHLNMGAGRIVYQELTRITKSIKDGDFFNNEEFLLAVKNAKENGKKLHLYGLLSDGGVHSHITHLYALIKLAKEQGLDNVFVHCFLDGRDVSPTSGADFIKDLQNEIDNLGFGTIASIGGRYYVMDRDNRWDRVEKAYDMMTAGIGEKTENAEEYVRKSYESGTTDEFVIPACVVKDGKPVGLIEQGDSIIFFNFRPDRARQITRAMSEKEFDGFIRKTGFLNPTYICFTRYDASFTNVKIAFKPQVLTNTLGEYIASLGLKQLRIAETEKYAHVTFFFNGGVEKANENEERELIASPKVATYDLQPEMSAYEVADRAIEKLSTNAYDVMILNFANCDMVGHTGDFNAAVKAVKVVDSCVKKVVDKILELGGVAIITADHGNADKMQEEDGSPFTAHTTNQVPFVIVGNDVKGIKLRDKGILADVAPTLLDLMQTKIPEEMSGKSLIIK